MCKKRESVETDYCRTFLITLNCHKRRRQVNHDFIGLLLASSLEVIGTFLKQLKFFKLAPQSRLDNNIESKSSNNTYLNIIELFYNSMILSRCYYKSSTIYDQIKLDNFKIFFKIWNSDHQILKHMTYQCATVLPLNHNLVL